MDPLNEYVGIRVAIYARPYCVLLFRRRAGRPVSTQEIASRRSGKVNPAWSCTQVRAQVYTGCLIVKMKECQWRRQSREQLIYSTNKFTQPIYFIIKKKNLHSVNIHKIAVTWMYLYRFIFLTCLFWPSKYILTTYVIRCINRNLKYVVSYGKRKMKSLCKVYYSIHAQREILSSNNYILYTSWFKFIFLSTSYINIYNWVKVLMI